MKALTRTVSREISYKDEMREVIAPVIQWIKKRHDDLDDQASREASRSDGIVGMIFACISLPIMFLSAWAWALSQAVLLYTVFFFVSVGWIAGFALVHKMKRQKAYERLISQEEHDPLHRRAVLIKEAVENYCEHCDRYGAGRELATQGVGLIDASAWDEYHAMLERSRTVILQSVENFEAARKHERKIKAFLKIHEPVQSSALSELVGLLDQPLEIPELPGVAALSDELKIGDDLVQLIEELKEGHDFDERLRATTKARVAALEDDLDADAKSEAFISAPCAKKA